MPPVVVVGAGMAGLSAAQSLHERGIATIVLEAADRPGGRLHTVDVAGSCVDLGAAWIHGPIGNPLTPLASDAGVTGYPTTFTENPKGLVAKQLGGPQLDAEEFTSGVRAFWQSADAAFSVATPQGTDRPDRSFADAITDGSISLATAQDRSTIATQTVQTGFDFASEVALQGHEASDLRDLSFDGYHYDTRPGGDILLADGGYRQLVNQVLSGLPDVRLHHSVQEVRQTQTGYSVVVAGNASIAARAVIVTTSIGVLQAGAIRFEPNLPKHVTDAIDSIGMGANEKLVVAFADWPWDKALGYAAITGSSDEDPYVSWLLRSDEPIAVSYAGGSRARQMGTHSDSEALAAGLERLNDLFGPLPAVLGSARTTWVDDPFTLGSYSYNTSRASVDGRATLSEPVRRGLILTGEAMNATDYGTAHGALIAGRRAADQIFNEFS